MIDLSDLPIGVKIALGLVSFTLSVVGVGIGLRITCFEWMRSTARFNCDC